jgi:hypothetical protein
VKEEYLFISELIEVNQWIEEEVWDLFERLAFLWFSGIVLT